MSSSLEAVQAHLKVPYWMLHAKAAEASLSSHIQASPRQLRMLSSPLIFRLWRSRATPPASSHNHRHCRRAAPTPSGPARMPPGEDPHYLVTHFTQRALLPPRVKRPSPPVSPPSLRTLRTVLRRTWALGGLAHPAPPPASRMRLHACEKMHSGLLSAAR